MVALVAALLQRLDAALAEFVPCEAARLRMMHDMAADEAIAILAETL